MRNAATRIAPALVLASACPTSASAKPYGWWGGFHDPLVDAQHRLAATRTALARAAVGAVRALGGGFGEEA
ncbi:hypothetical protein [Novosphingobium sp.]|uniref:hypothetical protein n=1 Tax=Novosphingobium sp. TaxID=1874826 RepID=UPI00260FAD7A|nr:hypothetical protein [Novosphingobium sp.]